MSSPQNEMKLIIPKGCDNAPRKQIMIDFTAAMLKQKNEIIKKYTDESIVWHQLKDNKTIKGQSPFINALQDENSDIPDCLEIYQVITHGKFASINGVIILADTSKIDFCDVYTFSNTAKSGKVKDIRSYRLLP